MDREQRRRVGTGLAVHGGRAGAAVEPLLDLGLQERALLLDDHDLVEALGEAVHDAGLERPGHPDAQQPHPAGDELGVGEPERRQRLPQVEPALAGGDDPDAGRAPPDDRVQAVGGGVAAGELEPGAVQVAFQGCQARAEQLRVRFVVERLAVDGQVGQDRHDAVRGDRGGAGPVGDRGDHLQADPAARDAGQVHGVATEVEDVLDVGRVEHREGHVGERGLGGAGHRRRLRGRVVSDDRERAAVGRGAGEVRVAQGVGGAVEAGRLAVPVAGDPVGDVVAQGAGRRGELRALDRGEGELLVQSGGDDDAVRLEQVAVAEQLEVVPRQRGTLVARDVPAGAQARGGVGPALVEREAHEGLDPGELHAALGVGVAVAQRHRGAARRGPDGLGAGAGDLEGHGGDLRSATSAGAGRDRPDRAAVRRPCGDCSDGPES